MTQTPLDDPNALSEEFPPLEIHEHNRAIGNLNNMAAFYHKRGRTRDPVTSKIFGQYGITIMYAIKIITLYRQLTNRLARMAGEVKNGEDEKRS